MAVYNSRIGTIEDDSDISIINPSMHDDYVDNTYVPIITRLKQANHSSENRQITNSQSNNNQSAHSSDMNNHEYIVVGYDPAESAKQLEQILMFYIRDLKQDSNNQLDCDKQLVTRIMDLIRSAYSNNQQKMIQLDKIVEEIGALHDKRHIDQQEKLEQLRTDRNRLYRTLFPTNNDQQVYENQTKNYSMFSTLNSGYPSTDVEQWTEIEDDAKKLHELVESQRNQINEIVSLISQTAAASANIDPQPNTPTGNIGDATTDNQPPPTPNRTVITDLFKKIIDISTRTPSAQQPQPQPQSPAVTARLPNLTLVNHSPGTSPSESLATLTLSTMQPTFVDPMPEQPETPVKTEEKPVVEKPHEPIDIPVPPEPTPTPAPVPAPEPVSPVEAKKCPVCNHEFPAISDDVEMYDHIERCLFPSGAAVEPKDYECPNCNRRFPGIDDGAYLQHLSDCYNQGF